MVMGRQLRWVPPFSIQPLKMTMSKNRMEAFSDGVLAIIITIMVLGLTTPRGSEPSNLVPLIPVFLSHLLSFINLGIYWNNHHHLLQAISHVDRKVLWANLRLLFWLSLPDCNSMDGRE